MKSQYTTLTEPDSNRKIAEVDPNEPIAHIYMTSHFSSLIGTGTVVGFNKFYVPKYAVKYTNIVKSKGQYFM
jgi:hypothetical protein